MKEEEADDNTLEIFEGASSSHANRCREKQLRLSICSKIPRFKDQRSKGYGPSNVC